MYTVSYYMLEFRDEVNEKWMMGFSEYKEKGFPDGLWTNYIEKMIVLDKQKVEVLMKATRASLRSRRIPEGANVMMQYFHDLGSYKWPCSITLQFKKYLHIVSDLFLLFIISKFQSRGKLPIRL